MRIATESTRAPAPAALRAGTLPSLFDETIERHAGHTAMRWREAGGARSLTYRDFGALLGSLGAGLIARGLERGERVALVADNSPAWCLVYAAVTSVGGVIVPLDLQLGVNEIRRLLLHCDARILVASRGIYEEKIADMRLAGTRIVVIGEGDAPPGAESLDGVLEEGRDLVGRGDESLAARRAAVEPGDFAAICYTSGTTGQPKGVVLLQRNLVANAEACRARVRFIETDVFLSLLPLFHTYATTCNFLAPVASGAAIFFGTSLKSRDIRENIETEGVTVICAVPLLFERMAQTLRKKMSERAARERLLFRAAAPVFAVLGRALRANVARAVYRKKLAADGLGSVRFCVSGAAALRPDVERTLSSVGIPVLQGYGMTEASPVISVNPLERAREGTIGPPLPGVEARIERPNEEGIGEIVVRGPNVMWGYYKNPEATAETLRDGWLHTGDLGRLDRHGYLIFVGREKSVIVTAGGKNVYPDELEAMLAASPYILDSVVLPARDRKGNEQVAAIVVPDYEAIAASGALSESATDEGVRSLVASEIRRVCAGLPEYKRIRDFRIRAEELPVTSTRKVKRHLVPWLER